MTESHLALPPFILETAIQKVRMAEDAWNVRSGTTAFLISQNPQRYARLIGTLLAGLGPDNILGEPTRTAAMADRGVSGLHDPR